MFNGKEPLVSIITLNYNQTAISCQFLESTRKLLYTNYEILVCDMGSETDPAFAIHAGHFPNTRVLLNDRNLGFAGGNNWGINQARGEFIFIINNDTEVTADLIHLLLEPFFINPDIGVTCPKIKFHHDRALIQYAGFNAMNYFTGRTSTVGELEKDVGQYGISGPTHAAHGCAMMVKRKVISITGMFPEKFFLYYEEWDWSARILKAGFIIWYVADATVYHKESATVGKNNPLKTYYLTRNRILFMRRNADFFHLVVFSFFFTFFSVPKSMIYYIKNRQYEHLKLFLKALIWNFYNTSSSQI